MDKHHPNINHHSHSPTISKSQNISVFLKEMIAQKALPFLKSTFPLSLLSVIITIISLALNLSLWLLLLHCCLVKFIIVSCYCYHCALLLLSLYFVFAAIIIMVYCYCYHSDLFLLLWCLVITSKVTC